MPTSPQDPEVPTEAPSTTEDHVPAPASTKASSGHEQTMEIQQASAKDGGRNASLPPGFPPIRPTKTVECNMMSYTDGEGVARSIYMPKGTAGLAAALHTARRFDDLAKFPAWDNQTYDDWEADEEKYAYLRDELGDPSHEL